MTNLPTGSNQIQMNFILAAMQETTGVIRVIDTKVAALFFALALPLTKLPSIWAICAKLVVQHTGFLAFVAELSTFLFALAWIVSFVSALRTLHHIDNPARCIGGDRPTGVYYNPNLFRPSLWDSMFSSGTESTVQFNTYFDSLPDNELTTRRELAFELMKLIYIRTIKMNRARLVYWAFYLWIILGGGLWSWSLSIR